MYHPRMAHSRAALTLAAIIGIFGAACGGEGTPLALDPTPQAFPEGFLFGASIAGFQVDMGCPTLPAAQCDDPNSDWYAYLTSPETRDDPATHIAGDPLSDSPGHWELYEHDYDLLKNEVGGNAMRLSIEWSRIFPTKTDDAETIAELRALASPDAVAHYHDELAALRARGLKPMVTLNHYTLPSWIHDAVGCHVDLASCSPRGWLDSERTVREIAKYAGFVAEEFGQQVDLWVTENEPLAVALPGYVMPSEDRSNPPGVGYKFKEGKAVINALIQAHARMYDAIRFHDQYDADADGKESEIGLVYAMVPIAPMDPKSEEDVKAAENVFYLYNMAFLNAVALGNLDENLDGNAVPKADLAGRMDFIGINYYTRATVETGPTLTTLSPLATFNPFTMQMWEDYPEGLYDMAKLVHDEFGLPSYVTENGKPDPDDDGTASRFMVQHLSALNQATRDRLDVRGYFYWSLIDNYEWNHGMGMRFGLYAVDPKDPTKERRARQTVSTYAEIIQARKVTDDLQQKYGQ